MKICVFGTWHLGCVTAACLAHAGYLTTGLDYDRAVIAGLRAGKAPLFEPGLDELIAEGIAAFRLDFATDPKAVAECDIVWVAFDTPVDDNDVADVQCVIDAARGLLPHLRDGAVVLISSQLPVGSTRALSEDFRREEPSKTCHFAYSPENLRLGKAIEIFRNAERIVVGCEDERVIQVLRPVLENFTQTILWMCLESAEMVKHAMNVFLATSVTFANEMASICERVGADAGQVEQALRLEPRIGPRAYIKPGTSFAGGTLARDVMFLRSIARREGLHVPLIDGILPSNKAHQRWPVRRLTERYGSLKGRNVAVLGLTYKPGTDTLRRSSSIEVCRGLAELGAKVTAFDPAIRTLPQELEKVIRLTDSIEGALSGADAAIVATEWPEFKSLSPSVCIDTMRSPLICDPNRFLGAAFENAPQITYITVGKA
ncbi:UDP-glucose dehydrogenase family protein [Methyloceanibacter sp.]|uniref:UDP-glucose dehydrogenase family protein n=1 Tax=Methyloceanibacter sp. TaxID=1965321 RepID=UPI003D6D8DE8